jgi:hypothetical protein
MIIFFKEIEMKKTSFLYFVLFYLLFACGTGSYELRAPLDGEEVNQLKPTLEWEPVEAAQYYDLQIGTDRDFKDYMGFFGIYNVYYTLQEKLENDTTYYWRIRAVDNDGKTRDWSNPCSFKVKLLVEISDLISPGYGDVITDEKVTLKWEDVKGVKEYELQVDYYDNFSDEPLITVIGLYGPQYTITRGLTSASYYWRVRAMDINGNLSPWSETGYFTYMNYEEMQSDLEGFDYFEGEDMGREDYARDFAPDYEELVPIYFSLLAPDEWEIYLDLYINYEWVTSIQVTMNSKEHRESYYSKEELYIIDEVFQWEIDAASGWLFIEAYGTVVTPDEEFNISAIEEIESSNLQHIFQYELIIPSSGNMYIDYGLACPWIYTWNDSEYKKQVEIIQNLSCKSLEATQIISLNDVHIENNLIKVKICEEKEEVSYIDEIVLIVNGETFYPVQDSQEASDISSIDGKYLILKENDSAVFTYRLPFDLSGAIDCEIKATGYYLKH